MDIDELRAKLNAIANEVEGQFSCAFVIKPHGPEGTGQAGVTAKEAIELPVMLIILTEVFATYLHERGMLQAADHMKHISNKLCRDLGMEGGDAEKLVLS